MTLRKWTLFKKTWKCHNFKTVNLIKKHFWLKICVCISKDIFWNFLVQRIMSPVIDAIFRGHMKNLKLKNLFFGNSTLFNNKKFPRLVLYLHSWNALIITYNFVKNPNRSEYLFLTYRFSIFHQFGMTSPQFFVVVKFLTIFLFEFWWSDIWLLR